MKRYRSQKASFVGHIAFGGVPASSLSPDTI
jgi:hypothetical protein